MQRASKRASPLRYPFSVFIKKVGLISYKSKNRFSLNKGMREPYRTKKKRFSYFYNKKREPDRTDIRKRFPFFISRSANRTLLKKRPNPSPSLLENCLLWFYAKFTTDMKPLKNLIFNTVRVRIQIRKSLKFYDIKSL